MLFYRMPQLCCAWPSATAQRMLTPEQIRAARAVLRWTQADLAAASKVAAITIKNIEAGGVDSKIFTLQKLRRAMEAAGVEFLDDGAPSLGGGPGLRIKPQKARR
mgnify:CR=1 FL=1